jgi:hypothetical protein
MTISPTPTLTDLAHRHLTLPNTVELLRAQQDAHFDVVVPGAAMRLHDGQLHLDGGGEPDLTPDGVTSTTGVFHTSRVFDEGIAGKLDIPLRYLRRMRDAHRVDLLDHNVNTWLDERGSDRFLLRAFRGSGGRPGTARALLSDSYEIIDHYNVLLTVLDGVRRAGVEVTVSSCDLSDRHMWVMLDSPEVAIQAPALLRDYRSPFTGNRGADNPVVSAGLLLTNSETGNGRWSIGPRLRIRVCDNGLVIDRDFLSRIHLGARLTDGEIRWSAETHRAALDLVAHKTRDAVTRFLSPGYLTHAVTDLQRRAGVPIADVPATLEHVTSACHFPKDAQDTILGHFIRGGDVTAGGVLQAVTSTAQTLEDPDDAHDMERAGIRAMDLAAAFQH